MTILGAVLALAGLGAAADAATQYPFGRGAGGCMVFPASSPWHEDISKLPVSPLSSAYVASIGADGFLHPDFGSNLTYGIPYAVVPRSQPKVAIHFTAYGDESDPGPYPIPAGAPVEGGAGSDGDRHVLVVQRGACKLYELYDAHPQPDGSWGAGSGAVFNLRSNRLRHEGWTSADAAGLPILPGLARYDEVSSGAIRHALRFTAERTSRAHIYPARHDAGSADPSLPPMGLRVRLKASVDISHLGKQARVIAQALKTYGMILADNGSPWFITGASDRKWNDDDLHGLGKLKGSDFEVVDTSALRNG